MVRVQRVTNVFRRTPGHVQTFVVRGDLQSISYLGMTSGYSKHVIDKECEFVGEYADLSMNVGDTAGSTSSFSLSSQLNTYCDTMSVLPVQQRQTIDPGNWDYEPGGNAVGQDTPVDLTSFNAAMGASHLNLPEDTTLEFFSAGSYQCYSRRALFKGKRWLIFSLGFAIESDQLEWMDAQYDKYTSLYPDINVIIVTHCFVGVDNSAGGAGMIAAMLVEGDTHCIDGVSAYFDATFRADAIEPDWCWNGGTYATHTWAGWKTWARLRFVFCGHTFLTGTPQGQRGPQRYVPLTADDGHTVHAFHVNYQPTGNTWDNEPGGPYYDVVDQTALTTEFVDYLRVIQITPDRIFVRTYSPVTGTFRRAVGGQSEDMIIYEGHGSW